MPAEIKSAAHGPAHYGGHGTGGQRARPAHGPGQRETYQRHKAEADKAGVGADLEVFVMGETGPRTGRSMKLK